MPARRAVPLTLTFDDNCPSWSYLHTGTLPPLIPFVSHSYENTGGVGVFFPLWNSLVACGRFDPGNERLSKSYTACWQLIADHRSLMFPACHDPVWEPFRLHCPSCLKSFSCNTCGHPPQLLQTRDLRRSTLKATPFRCNTYKKPGGAPDCSDALFASRMDLRDIQTCFRSLPSRQHWCYHLGRNLELTTYD
jgi:hypothetical protein